MLGAVERFTSSAADNETNWDELLLHPIAARNSSVSRGTGLAPNEVHI